MTHARLAYLPLPTYPEPVEDAAVTAAVALAASLGFALHATAFSVDIPSLSSGLGDLLIDVPALVRAAEDKSKAECQRLQGVVQQAAMAAGLDLLWTTQHVALGATHDWAASEARYFDLTLLPWSPRSGAVQDLAQALVFGAGRPSLLVPSGAKIGRLDHIAIAWDASRFAARALGDALPLLAEGGRISVLTAAEDKPMGRTDIGRVLATMLERRGFRAAPLAVTPGQRSIAQALQEVAQSSGAQLLAMGGFGHSRVRDFILGGATKGVLADLHMPVLLSH